jgi:hypothetical protein
MLFNVDVLRASIRLTASWMTIDALKAILYSGFKLSQNVPYLLYLDEILCKGISHSAVERLWVL